mgnify:CR=1 FL=1
MCRRRMQCSACRGLFDFIQWVDYCYGTDYVERSFDETAIPRRKGNAGRKEDPGAGKFTVPERCRVGSLAQAGGEPFGGVHGQQTAEPAEPQFHRRRPDRGRDAAEDHRHRSQGHGLEIHRAGCRCAHRVRSGQHERRAGAEGLCRLCSHGKDGKPLAVIEAKRSTKDPNIGRKTGAVVCGLSGTEIRPPPDAVHHQRLRHLFLGRSKRPAAAGERRVLQG